MHSSLSPINETRSLQDAYAYCSAFRLLNGAISSRALVLAFAVDVILFIEYFRFRTLSLQTIGLSVYTVLKLQNLVGFLTKLCAEHWVCKSNM